MAVNPRNQPLRKAASADSPPRRPSAEAAFDRRAGTTRQAVLEAALEVFCEQTYGGARIEQIAQRAGVAPGTIYKHFPGKQALANEVFRSCKLKTREYSFSRTPGMTARERFHEWFVQYNRFAGDHPLAHEFLQTHHHAPYLDAESLAVGDPMDQLALRTMREGQKEGALRNGDPELLVAMVLGLLLGLERELRGRNVRIHAVALAFGEECALGSH